MSTQKIYVFHGLPGSGKSTLAQKLAQETPNTVIVNRDTIRENLFGAEYHKGNPVPDKEKEVTKVQNALIDQALRGGKNLITDDTNLNPRFLGQWWKLADKYGAQVEQVQVDVPVEVAKERNRLRGENGGRFVPEHVIDKMAETSYDDEGKMKEFVYAPSNGSVWAVGKNSKGTKMLDSINEELAQAYPMKGNAAVIVDVDGTLFDNEVDAKKYLGGKKKNFPAFYRSIKDAKVNREVVDLITEMRDKDGVNVILLSGRSNESARHLYEAMKRNGGVPASRILMKRHDDFRKSSDFKREQLLKLKSEGIIPVHAIDDRAQDIDMFEREGVIVSRVIPSGEEGVPPTLNTFYGKGYCMRCGKPLKNGNIGPVCKTKMDEMD